MTALRLERVHNDRRVSARFIFRLALSAGIIALVWIRALREWHYQRGWWLFGTITLSLILVLVVVLELVNIQRRRNRLKDSVPKNPLGLD